MAVLAVLAAVIFLAPACSGDDSVGQVVIGSLSQPRGLWVDADGVCVAEAGAIGPDGADRERPGQLEADTGRVICAPLVGGDPEVKIDGLPFVYYPEAAVTSGAADVIRSGDELDVLVGESYGDLSRSVVTVDEGVVGAEGGVVAAQGGEPRVIADLLAFAEDHAISDGGVRSNPYSFVAAKDDSGFFVTEAAAGTVVWVGRDGAVDTFAPVPGHEVLTGITWGPDDDLYVASFGQLPHEPGTAAVLAIDTEGTPRVALDGLTMAIDVAFDSDGALFVLEYSTPPADPSGVAAYRDNAGRVSWVPPGETAPSVLLEGLNRPTSLAIYNGALYISISGGEQAAGEGSVVTYPLTALVGR